MTIKTQNGKVITKDGKVSCECCECCLYPAQGLADGDYSEDDLPDAVTVDGVSFDRSGTGYGDTTNGVILDGNVWAKYRNGVRSNRPCLIQGGVVDQFADTYAVNWFIVDDVGASIATRRSLCIWSFMARSIIPQNFEFVEYLIEYSPDILRVPFRWRIVSLEVEGLETFKAEPSFENTPTGFYATGNFEITVS
jgi:hypothetical protein